MMRCSRYLFQPHLSDVFMTRWRYATRFNVMSTHVYVVKYNFSVWWTIYQQLTRQQAREKHARLVASDYTLIGGDDASEEIEEADDGQPKLVTKSPSKSKVARRPNLIIPPRVPFVGSPPEQMEEV